LKLAGALPASKTNIKRWAQVERENEKKIVALLGYAIGSEALTEAQLL